MFRDTLKVRILFVEGANPWRYLNARGAHDRHRDEVAKTESALVGICEEAKFGQRTTFDTLQAQPVLVDARIALTLSAQTLKLNAPDHAPR